VRISTKALTLIIQPVSTDLPWQQALCSDQSHNSN
jgi:hypothetical protein